MKTLIILVFGLTVVLAGCGGEKPDTAGYRAEIEKWRSERLERLKSRNGWLNLAGLYWLHDGMNSFGSDSSNEIVFPVNAPLFIGTLELKDDTVYLRDTRQPVLVNGFPVSNIKLADDSSDKPSISELDSFVWTIIKRDNRYGIRLRDLKSPLIRSLTHIPHFETDEKYRVVARFFPYNTPEKYKVQTIIGTEEESLVPGELHFRLGRKNYVLYPFAEEGRLFLVFGDRSNGDETYPSGRFLYMDGPDENERVIVDFNKAYNPPCAFTPFATCPLPVKKNIIAISINAGEKMIHISLKP